MMYLGAALLMVWLGMFCPTESLWVGGALATSFGAAWAYAWRV